MNRKTAERLCGRLNQSRGVICHRGAPNEADFWDRCMPDSNFVIQSSDPRDRARLLVRMLISQRSVSSEPVIVLTSSSETMNAVIAAAKDNMLGLVQVSSQRYPNYLAFHGMNQSELCNLMYQVAQTNSYTDLSKIYNYIQAFVAVTAAYFTPSLATMTALDSQIRNNANLISLGQRAHVGIGHLNSFNQFPEGQMVIHSLLSQLRNSYEKITNRNGNPYNLITGSQENLLMCMDIHSNDPRIFDLALAAELRHLLNEGTKFTLILDNVQLMSENGLCKLIADAKNTGSNVTVGVCTRNIGAWSQQIPGLIDMSEILLNDFQAFFLHNDGTISDADLNKLLDQLGQYDHYEVQRSGGYGATLVRLIPTDEWTVVRSGIINRVRPQDMREYPVLLRGHDGGRIHLYSRLSN